MNKLTKLMLANAMMITSGFAAETVATLHDGATINDGGTLELCGDIISLEPNKSILVYGKLDGYGEIECASGANVTVHGKKYAQELTNADSIKTANELNDIDYTYIVDDTYAGTMSQEIEVTPPEALTLDCHEMGNYCQNLPEKSMMYVANRTGEDEVLVGGDSSSSVFSCAFANTDASLSGKSPVGLKIEKKCKFTGNNTAFTNGKVTIGGEGVSASVEFAKAESLFGTEIDVVGESELIIAPLDDVNLKTT